MPDLGTDIFADFDEPQRPLNGQEQPKGEAESSAVSSSTGTSSESVQDDPSRATAKPSEPSQPALFEKGEWWEDHWKGMPEFKQSDLMPFKSIVVHFEKRADMEAFSKLVNQQILITTKSIWYPEADIAIVKNLRWVGRELTAEEIEADEAEIDE